MPMTTCTYGSQGIAQAVIPHALLAWLFETGSLPSLALARDLPVALITTRHAMSGLSLCFGHEFGGLNAIRLHFTS